MGSRTIPTDCPHGRTLDWGDFGPDPGDGSVGAEHCPECQGPPTPAGPFVVATAASREGSLVLLVVLASPHDEIAAAQAVADEYNRNPPHHSVRAVVCSLVPVEPLEGP